MYMRSLPKHPYFYIILSIGTADFIINLVGSGYCKLQKTLDILNYYPSLTITLILFVALLY
jgi:hypothetical protein